MNSSNPIEMLGKHDFGCGFPTVFQTLIQRLHSTRSPADRAPVPHGPLAKGKNKPQPYSRHSQIKHVLASFLKSGASIN
jgi:hypothetical protein